MMECIKVIGTGDMPVKRHRIKLRQYCNPVDSGVNTVTDRNVDQAVFSRNRDSGFERILVNGYKPAAAPPPKSLPKYHLEKAIARFLIGSA